MPILETRAKCLVEPTQQLKFKFLPAGLVYDSELYAPPPLVLLLML
jgi:hypothetical protein